MTSHRAVSLVVAVVVATLVLPLVVAYAGEFHEGTELHCSQCHQMHGGSTGSGYSHLLTKASVNEICLGCHNRTTPGSTPDVVVTTGQSTDSLPVADGLCTAYGTEPYGSSAGFFLSDYATVASPFGHDLGPAQVTAVQGTWHSGATGMTCGDCHEVHGNGNWRNIKANPDDAGTDIDVTASTSGSDDVLMSETLDTAATPPEHYLTSHAAFNANNDISSWCIDCHTTIANSSTTKHPVNRSLADGAANGTVDETNWTGGTGRGFGATIDDQVGGTEYGVPRVRFAQSGSTFSACSAVGSDNQVMCLTCHKAHGSKYTDSLCWPYKSLKDSGGTSYSPIDRAAACQQCHDRGA